MSNGTVTQIIGAVIDVEFDKDNIPKVYEALMVDESGTTLEVQQQLGDGVVRTIAMGATEGLKRGLTASRTNAPISVPVGPETLGRIVDVLGNPIDEKGPIGEKSKIWHFSHIMKNSKIGKTIKHMADQEQEHIDKFNELIVEHRIRPTALLPLWNVAGFALGASTALLGEKAAMACTVAVEKVIGEHYQEQIELLKDDHKDLKKTISKFRDDELEHHDICLLYTSPSPRDRTRSRMPSSA